MEKIIYSGTLQLRKKTCAMLVFGNTELTAQYVPKTLFKEGNVPKEIVFTLSIASIAPKKAVVSATERKTPASNQRNE